MTRCVFLLMLILTGPAYSGGWSQWAVPERIDIETERGFMVYGGFGNPSGCSRADQFYVDIHNKQYKEIYALVLAAISAKKMLQVHTRDCQALTWFSNGNVTYNIFRSTGGINLKY